MKKKKYTVILIILVLTLCNITWAEAPRSYGGLLENLGLIDGTGSGLEEDRVMLREELVTILVRLSDQDGIELRGKPHFVDVSKDHWSYGYLEKAYHLGISKGVEENKFGLGQQVDQQQATMFIMRFLGQKANWSTAIEDARTELAIDLDSNKLNNKSGVFTRGDFFQLLCKALMSPIEGQNYMEKSDMFDQTSLEGFSQGFEGIRQRLMPDQDIDNSFVFGNSKQEGTHLQNRLIEIVTNAKFDLRDEAHFVDFCDSDGLEVHFNFEHVYKGDASSSEDTIMAVYHVNFHKDQGNKLPVIITSSQGLYNEVWQQLQYYYNDYHQIYMVTFFYDDDMSKRGVLIVQSYKDGLRGTISRGNILEYLKF